MLIKNHKFILKSLLGVFILFNELKINDMIYLPQQSKLTKLILRRIVKKLFCL